ncbi:lipocalin family protein [Rubellimicrobium sp. CFH 75288]|uniref:lipocalin family protein n=1 Tax=Rubellimicrobium sp. CFH 75288 TaxID=2697034 RepID=UPI001412D31A|nr:lipocalin family protein [Rubellimicrobium sp. CFH 75288]NAZ37943.1 lipocalin [Rubellimicrobium sp. CFH 75288]
MRAPLLLLVLLAACGRPAPEAPEPVAAPSFRDPAIPIASSLRAGAADLAGEWVVARAYPGGPLPLAAGTPLSLRMAEGGALLWSAGGRTLRTEEVARGRFRAGGTELWLLWTDDDGRTAVIGSPDGRAGWIMDRAGRASSDRARAAREMLDFNGFDLARLP